MIEQYFSAVAPQARAKFSEALVTGMTMGFPGLSMAIGTTAQLLWTGAIGEADITTHQPITDTSCFGIGSITKIFIAVIAFQLVQEDKLALHVPVTTYVTHPIVAHIPNATTASLQQLLNHTSGIPSWEFQPDWIRRARGDALVPGALWRKTETLEYVINDHSAAAFAPGTQYAYSNTNYTLLGLAIEAVTGNELTAEIRQRILNPLRMRHTFMESFETSPEVMVHRYHYATPTFEQQAGISPYFARIHPYVIETTAANLSPEWAAGGLISTPSDLITFAQALRAGRLLSSDIQRAMFTYLPSPNSAGSEYMQGIMRLPNMYNSLALIGHGGGTLGFSAALYWFEERDIIISAMINIGSMHSGIHTTPFSLYIRHIVLPILAEYATAAS